MQRHITLTVLLLGASVLSLGGEATPEDLVILPSAPHEEGPPASVESPALRLSQPRPLSLKFFGPAARVAAFNQGKMPARALAAADFDEDGMPDLLVGHAAPDGKGAITLHRGNVDSVYPNEPEARLRRANGTFTDAPFLAEVQVFGAAEACDLMGAGDFDADGHRDAVTARRGGRSLWWHKGDGKGSLGEPQKIELPGPVTTLTVGEINRRDGLEDIVVAVGGAGGARVLVFEGPEGALKASPEEIPLAGPIAGMVLGRVDDDTAIDLVVAAGPGLYLIRGRDRRLSLDEVLRADVRSPAVSTMALPFTIQSVALGDFDGNAGLDVALLDAERRLSIVRAKDLLEGASTAAENLSLVPIAVSGRAGTRPSMRLVRARLSARPGDDLLLLDSGASGVLARDASSVGADRVLEMAHPFDAVVDALGMRLGPDALDDLVLLADGEAIPRVADIEPLDVHEVTNTSDSGPGSLRQAILNANADPDLDTITFNILGAGPHTIQPVTLLPIITHPVVIDGTTEPDYAGTPVVTIDGIAARFFGLRVQGGASTIKGLVINRFDSSGVAIELSVGHGNHVEGNFIGTNPAGTMAAPNTAGIVVRSLDNVIGGTTTGARNVISGNVSGGVVPALGGDNTIVQGNTIGLDETGTASLPNTYGIIATEVLDLTVGGTTASARNVISATSVGVEISEGLGGGLIQGNYIGTNAAGTGSMSLGGNGIILYASGNTIGGTTPSARNVIGGFDTGIAILTLAAPVTGNAIQGNYVGLGADGATPLPGILDGIEIRGGPDNFVGGFTSAARNVIGAYQVGIELRDGDGNDVLGNYIGTNAAGTAAVANDTGVRIRSNGHRIGGPSLAAANLISGNTDFGIDIVAGTGNLVEVNLIGTDPTGTMLLPNPNVGIAIRSPGNMVGVKQDQGNIIAGATDGILIQGAGADGNRLQGNRIGTDVSGTIALPNVTGVLLSSDAADNVIGGILGETGNVISGNLDSGVEVTLGASFNQIRGNLLGTGLSGLSALPNGTGIAVDVDSTGNVIGSTAIAERNVISGNLGAGVAIYGYTNFVVGNYIGTSKDGAALGNGSNGVLIDAPPDPSISDGEFNLVGYDDVDTPGTANVIAHNGGAGVLVASGDINQIRGNIMFGNSGLGIDLGGDFVTINDPEDPDPGPNRLQNFPILTTVTTTGGSTSIGGTLDSVPDSLFHIDFYASPTCDPLGHGEGNRHLGKTAITTGPPGAAEASFLFGSAGSVAAGEIVTATATKGGGGGTSEFSPCASAVGVPPSAVSGVTFDTGPPETVSWNATPGATLYHAYAGTRATLSGLASPAADSCEAGIVSTPGFTLPSAATPPPGQMFWFLVTAEGPYGEGPVQPGSGGPRDLTSVGPCGDSCAHEDCEVGVALEPACTPCASIICDVDPFCCDPVAGSWDAQCVQEMRTVCRSLRCAESQGACAHDLCCAGCGEPLLPGCDSPPLPVSCTAAVCQVDPHCCQQTWDDACVAKVATVCGYGCV